MFLGSVKYMAWSSSPGKSLVTQEQKLGSCIRAAIKYTTYFFGEGYIGLLEISVDPILSFWPGLVAWLLLFLLSQIAYHFFQILIL